MLKTFCTCAALPLCYQLCFTSMSLVCFAVLSQNADVAIIEMKPEIPDFKPLIPWIKIRFGIDYNPLLFSLHSAS